MYNSTQERWLTELFKIRFFEEKIAQIYPQQLIRCPVHLAIGQEAAAVGVCEHLTSQDLAFGYHRSHHHYLAKGGSPQKLLWELLGDARGCSGGRGGSTHLTSPEAGFVASTAIISGTLPVASGVAHSLKLKGSASICVAFCGDAALEEGVFFETLNMACLWKTPLLFVIEDNDLSCYTPKATRQAFKKYSQLAEIFEIPYFAAEGSDIADVSEKAQSAIAHVRKSGSPAIIDIKVFRALEHCGPESDDLLAYRNVAGSWPQKDPIFNLKKYFSEIDYEKFKKICFDSVENLFNAEIEAKRAQ